MTEREQIKQLQARVEIAESALEEISTVMCETFMVKRQPFGREQGKWIMNILEAAFEKQEKV